MSAIAEAGEQRRRAWLHLAAYFALTAILVVNDLPGYGPLPGDQIWFALLCPVFCVAIVFRDRLPWLVFAVAVAAVSTNTVALISVAMIVLGIRVRPALLWIAAALSVVALVAMRVVRDIAAPIDPALAPEIAPIALVIGSLVVAPALVGTYFRAHRALTTSLRARAELAERERLLLADQAVASERERIARELHDSLGRSLTLISLQAAALEQDSSDQSTVDDARGIATTARAAIDELGGVVTALAHPGSAPTLDDIAVLVDESRAAGAEIEFEDRVSGVRDPVEVARMAPLMFRAVRESLTNAHRHAPGRQVRVLLGADPEHAYVSVENDARTVEPSGSRTGLATLGRDLSAVGGRLAYDRTDNRFVLRAEVPWALR